MERNGRRLSAERGKAFGIHGTVMGSSSGLGVVLGGVPTDYLDWRWCMYVNLPIALAAGAGPLLPLRAVLDRRRGGSYLAVLSLAVAWPCSRFSSSPDRATLSGSRPDSRPVGRAARGRNGPLSVPALDHAVDAVH
ncbi:hypothetical protein FHR32_008041 [Streptosporangium album]|uniref:Major facilitator superfamily (MFS) profile domain-containing protein n=1 Tax=Streptosporangium album TaxID=47479 RepID=A0A7W7S4A2_9ACTN|nr:MFS transporter [Streptosporangium album]MBB4943641.1 hypothetical protein [Streptosporangium album]